jgi:dihydroneopterin aldolase
VWPKQPRTPLLETQAQELVNFLFYFDTRIERVNVGIMKLKAIPQARSIGERMAMTRRDHESSFGCAASIHWKEVSALTLMP